MDPSSAEREINRIEKELDAKSPPPRKQLTTKQKTQLSAGAVGAAAGLAIGYGVGGFRP